MFVPLWGYAFLFHRMDWAPLSGMIFRHSLVLFKCSLTFFLSYSLVSFQTSVFPSIYWLQDFLYFLVNYMFEDEALERDGQSCPILSQKAHTTLHVPLLTWSHNGLIDYRLNEIFASHLYRCPSLAFVRSQFRLISDPIWWSPTFVDNFVHSKSNCRYCSF